MSASHSQMYYSNQCVKSAGRRDGVKWGIADVGVVNRAQPVRALVSAQWVPYRRKFPIRKTIGPFDTNKSSVFCLCGSSFVLVECCLWPITGLGWLSSSECVLMFLRVLFVVSSHCSRASVACGYVFLLCLLVEDNRELQKHLLRQHKHSHTLEIIIELRMPPICLIWCVCVLF